MTSLSRLGAVMAARPRLAFGGLAGIITLTVMAAPAVAAPPPKDPCDKMGGFSGIACDVGNLIPGVKGMGDIWVSADETRKAISSVASGSFLDDWAKSTAEAVTFLLAFVDSTAEKLSTPAYSQPWWQKQYAVSFGLALIVLAFMMVLITARIGSADGSVSGVELLRKSGFRLIFVFPAIAIAPGFLYSLQQLAMSLTKSFSTEAMKDGHGAVGEMMTQLKDSAGDWGRFGGVFVAIAMMVFIFLASLILLVEIAVSQWGLMLAGLLVPFALVAAVYPPWSHVLRKVSALICTLMFLPVFVFFFFWTVWAAFKDMIGGDHAQNSGFSLLLFLLISFLMIDAFPLVAMWLMSLVTGDGASPMDAGVRGLVPSPTEGSPSAGSGRDKEFHQTDGEYDGGGGHGDSDGVDDADSEGGGMDSEGDDGSVDKSAPGHADDDQGDDVSGDAHIASETDTDPGRGAGNGEETPGSGDPQDGTVRDVAPEPGSPEDAAGGGTVRGGPGGGAVEGGAVVLKDETTAAESRGRDTTQENTNDDGGDER
ncbi:hypothetical protein ACIPW5_39080 [Streptomyces sp. NPDC090077]|uniref:hypothetical protein n=1 Tax=Streptomyces sp. NPDC090077 TaxID=3365938 RepID=UPI00382ED896